VSTNVTDTLLTLAADRFQRDRAALKPEDDFFDALEIDSVDAMTLLTAVEERFGIEIPDYEVQDVRTFSALAAVIERRV
jgi:acyl carrier protein